MQYTVHYWMIGRPEAEADAAYDAGLTDAQWVFKGGMMFAEVTREGASLEEVAEAFAAELEHHKVPFDRRTLNLSDPTDYLEQHPGYYEEDELEEMIEEIEDAIAGDYVTDEDQERLVFLKRNLELLKS